MSVIAQNAARLNMSEFEYVEMMIQKNNIYHCTVDIPLLGTDKQIEWAEELRIEMFASLGVFIKDGHRRGAPAWMRSAMVSVITHDFLSLVTDAVWILNHRHYTGINLLQAIATQYPEEADAIVAKYTKQGT